MSYKIKVKEDDFVVKERYGIDISDRGEYSVFLLYKRGWNTDELLKRISQDTGIDINLFFYGGRKDRHSVSEQIITIRGNYKNLNYKSDFCNMRFLGFSSQPMSPKLIISNHFEINVRDINPDKRSDIQDRIEEIKDKGFVNYFDAQRFRSYDEQGFIAERILKRHYNGALKIILTATRDEDRLEDKKRKRFFFENWGDWKKCLAVAKTPFEKFAFKRLLENKNDYLNIIRSITKGELSMYFSAYQSFLFNEITKIIIAKLSDKYATIEGVPFELYIPVEIESKKYEYLKGLKIPTVAEKMEFINEEIKTIYENLLINRGIKRSMFNLRKIRKAYFKSAQRNVIEFPKDLSFSFENDELYNSKLKLIISFDLPVGSYATMLIKQIFL